MIASSKHTSLSLCLSLSLSLHTFPESHFSLDFVLYYSVKRPPQFDAWIDMYGGDDFEKEVRDYIAMVDAACETADPDTLRRMETHFIMCCKLEHMFWDQAQDCMEWPESMRVELKSSLDTE